MSREPAGLAMLQRPPLRRAPAGGPGHRRTLVMLTAVAVVAVLGWSVVLREATRPLPGPGEIVSRTAAFVSDLLGGATDTAPAWSQAASWQRMAELALDTVVMSVLAMGIAGLGALVTVTWASRLLTVGEFAPRRRMVGRATLAATRGLHAVCRSVPELIWALLIVFILRPGILAGAVALALHEIGVLGRLGSDVVDDLDPAPLRTLRSAGAGHVAILLYGVLPQALPQFITFLLYRWEMVIRATVIVGFITAAGLGYQLRLELSFRRWTEVGLILLVYVLLVWGVEALSSLLRRLAR